MILIRFSQWNNRKVKAVVTQLSRCLLSLQCITNEARKQGISSSLHMPDKVLNFVKDHFLMDSVIRSQPLLLKRNVRYTQIAVHRIQAVKKVYHVLFIGTGTIPHPQTDTVSSSVYSSYVPVGHSEFNFKFHVPSR